MSSPQFVSLEPSAVSQAEKQQIKNHNKDFSVQM
jgi:hypothetical protein